MDGKHMSYRQLEEYILNIPRFRPEGSIEQTRKFYEFLEKPGNGSLIIHVAGTNGKGSTCAYMNSVLKEAGYKVGMFTSPHLVTVRERIRINHELISEEEWISGYKKLEEKLNLYHKFQKENREMNSTYDPTFYEVLFFMAMLYFETKKTEVIILETGLGGRLDATNVIDAPKVAVITEIGKDHMEYLGDTFEKIAKEKAGIIKKGSVVVYSRNRQESAQVIEQKTKELGILCKCVEKIGKQEYSFVDKKIDFSFFSRYYGYIPIILNTCAIYQIDNARLALTALEELEIEFSEHAIKKGMGQCKWEGRMEEILPNVYVDGAHNEDGIDAFIESVKSDRCQGKRWLLFSAVADKDYEVMKNKLLTSELFDYLYVAPLRTARGIDKKKLEVLFADYRLKPGTDADNDFMGNLKEGTVRISKNTKEALQEILSKTVGEDRVYVTGSLYLVGEIKEEYM